MGGFRSRRSRIELESSPLHIMHSRLHVFWISNSILTGNLFSFSPKPSYVLAGKEPKLPSSISNAQFWQPRLKLFSLMALRNLPACSPCQISLRDCSGYRPSKNSLLKQQANIYPRLPIKRLLNGAWQTLPRSCSLLRWFSFLSCSIIF